MHRQLDAVTGSIGEGMRMSTRDVWAGTVQICNA